MIASEEEARAFCEALVDRPAMRRLNDYAALLGEENRRQNLVSVASLAHLWQRHIADSLQLLLHVPRGTAPWLDLGSGAGPPGLLVAAARPEEEVRLIESRSRRADWLQFVTGELGLANCRVLPARLEQVDTFTASVISARAFAPLGRLLGLSTRFSTSDTIWLLPKGRSAEKELSEQTPAVQAMFHVERSLTDPEARLLIGRGRPAIA